MAARSRFRLQPVLRLREYREDEAKRRLGALRRELSGIEDRLRTAVNQAARHTEALRMVQGPGPVNTVELAQHRHWLARLNRIILETQAERRAMEAQVAQARADLDVATRERKVLQKLKDRQMDRYRKFVTRTEQREMDDLSTIRFVHRAHQEAT